MYLFSRFIYLNVRISSLLARLPFLLFRCSQAVTMLLPSLFFHADMTTHVTVFLIPAKCTCILALPPDQICKKPTRHADAPYPYISRSVAIALHTILLTIFIVSYVPPRASYRRSNICSCIMEVVLKVSSQTRFLFCILARFINLLYILNFCRIISVIQN